MPIYEYHCEACGVYSEHICSHESRPDAIPCTCGQAAGLVQSIPNVTRATYLDGTGRFDGLREQRQLQKAQRKAAKQRNRAEVARTQTEINRLNKK
jgi:predicted nucleic acid-binding Zn ribbon protein